MAEFIKRIVMGIVMIIAVIAAVLYLSPIYFFIAVACVILLTGYEWSSLITDSHSLKATYLLVLLACLMVMYCQRSSSLFAVVLLQIDLAAILMGLMQLLIFPKNPRNVFVCSKWIRVVLSLVTLSATQYFIVLLHEHGNFWIIYVIALVAMFDSGAYFVGRSFGKHRLAKNISPKKSWEGFLGGCVLGLLWSLFMVWCLKAKYPITHEVWFFAMIMTVLMSIFSVWGDLYESMQKRIAGKKDSSHFIPGHGGFYDRIDALIFVLPLMFIYREILVFLINKSIWLQFLSVGN
jgi:phosphatidate cytidylyltransferase